MFLRVIFFIIPLFLVSNALLAIEKPSSAGILSLSLDELLKTNVTAVSKRSEPISKAPAVVSVISREEIDAFGAKNIKDVLQRAPSLFLFDSATFIATGVSLRAGTTQHLNNHVLYLLDGRPLREAQNGGFHTDINLLLPIDLIERIEIVRGPGSVLYGSNAFSGTINFITKAASQEVESKVSLSSGSHGYDAVGYRLSVPGKGSNYLNIDVSRLSDDGQVITVTDEVGETDSRRQFSDGESIFVKGKFADIDIMLLSTEIEHPIFSGAFRWPNNTLFQASRDFVNLSYEYALSDDWQSHFNYTLNNFERVVFSNEVFSESQFDSMSELFELTLHGKVNDKLGFIVGGSLDDIEGDLGARGGRYKAHRSSFYFQGEFSLTHATELEAGFQWNKPENKPGEVAPRIALLHQFNQHYSSKLLYGEAFRLPYGSELFFQSPFLLGDENLLPETIKTTEFQLSYARDNLQLSSTFFYSDTNDLIGRALVHGTNTFVNIDQPIVSHGAELEINWGITSSWRFQGSYTYQKNSDIHGVDDILPGAAVMAKLGVRYQSKSGYALGFWNNYFGDSSRLESILGSRVQTFNPPADAVNLLSFSFTGNLGELVGNSAWSAFNVSIFANNVLDESVYFPELGRKLVNTFPQSHERGLVLKLSYRF